MLRGNYYYNKEQTTTHSPSSFIRKKTLELENHLYSPINKKQFFPTLPPFSNRNNSNFKIFNSLKKKGHFPPLPKIDSNQKKEEKKYESFDTYSNSIIISPSISFENKLNTNEPVLFHKKIITEGCDRFNERMNSMKKEIRQKEDNELIFNLQGMDEKEDEKSDIEKIRFVKEYKKREIDNEVINIINQEKKRSKAIKELERYRNKNSRNWYLTKPLYLQKLEPIMFISKNHPMLEFNQIGTIEKMFQDGPFMGKLLHDSFEHMNDKRYQIAL